MVKTKVSALLDVLEVKVYIDVNSDKNNKTTFFEKDIEIAKN